MAPGLLVLYSQLSMSQICVMEKSLLTRDEELMLISQISVVTCIMLGLVYFSCYANKFLRCILLVIFKLPLCH